MKKLTTDQTEAVGKLLAVEAHYLRTFDWIPLAPIVANAPIFWIDPIEKENELAQDRAIEIQKGRVNEILYRNHF